MDRFGGAIFPHRLEPRINSRDFPALREPFSGIFQLNSPARIARWNRPRKREREREPERETGRLINLSNALVQKCVRRRRRRRKKSDKGCWFEAAKRKNGSRNVTSGVKPWRGRFLYLSNSRRPTISISSAINACPRRQIYSGEGYFLIRLFPLSLAPYVPFVSLSFDADRDRPAEIALPPPPVRGGGEGWPLSSEKS